jgi:poly[(R)-3-hydroxyalkanoate] polymerase subunit PhaC
MRMVDFPPAMGLWWSLRRADDWRRERGELFDRLGLGPVATPSRVVLELPELRLLAHDGRKAAPPLLIVAAPIKRAYIWDLHPSASVVRRCREHGLAVYLIEWIAHDNAELGLADYADRLPTACFDAIARETGERRVLLAGHSLGGTLAAIFAALHPECVRGLVLLEAPTKFGKDAGAFALPVALTPARAISNALPLVPGSFLDLVSVAAAPGSFLLAPRLDALSIAGDAEARMLHLRVERWTLDELPMPGRLFADVVDRLYYEDRFLSGDLIIAGRKASPAALHMPLLVVHRPGSVVIPPSSELPLLDAVPSRRKQRLAYAGDRGVLLQHVGVLVGRTAHARLWPAILTWIDGCR